jgi:hypothetical protein
VGYLTTYDATLNRIIVTKKDYVLTQAGVDAYNNGLLAFTFNNSLGGSWIVGDDLDVPATNPYKYPEYFENKSWTKSFDLEEKVWVSYHSYLPHYMWFNQNDFYSNIFGNYNLWQHNKGDYQSYYGVVYPHMLELVNNRAVAMTKTGDSIQYISNMKEYDANTNQLKDVRFDTFDKLIAYNDFQSTGEIPLSVKEDTDPFASQNYSTDRAYVSRNERTWTLNNIRDLVIQTNPEQALFSKVWSNTDYQSQYPIDKVVNNNIIDNTKTQFELQKFRDNFLITRYILESPNNRKITTQFANLKTRLSFR